tara:strand:- start:721 stop:1893 length:1173 start_codon:yes stop_codon:yes gene_type:complete
LNLGISIKIIFFSFIFINFSQPSKSAELKKINNSENHLPTNFNWSTISQNKIQSNLFFSSKVRFFDEKLLKQKLDTLYAFISEDKDEIVIQSDKQSEVNNVINAEGNVSVSYNGKLLQADNLIYDKLNKKISAKGNIKLIFGDQIFRASLLEYSFINEKGYLLDVQGSINTNTLLDDLSSNFSSSDSNELESLLELRKKEVINTPNKVENWLFSTDKITIDGKKWESRRALFSNDLLEFKQVKLEINSLKVISEEDKLRFNSSLNYLIFEEKGSIPFWLGNRTVTNSSESFNLKNRWNLGYENLDKDGYFIGRKFDTIDITDDFILDLEPQFLIQRSVKGYTKSFVKKDDSITSEKVKRDVSFEDYFALRSQIKGPINLGFRNRQEFKFS